MHVHIHNNISRLCQKASQKKIFTKGAQERGNDYIILVCESADNFPISFYKTISSEREIQVVHQYNVLSSASKRKEFPLRNDFFHHSVRFIALNVKNTFDVISHKGKRKKNSFFILLFNSLFGS